MLNPEKMVEIAQQAANRRGYAIYADYDDDLRHEICVERTLEPSRAGRYLQTIKSILERAEWTHEDGRRGRPARFYPPA